MQPQPAPIPPDLPKEICRECAVDRRWRNALNPDWIAFYCRHSNCGVVWIGGAGRAQSETVRGVTADQFESALLLSWRALTARHPDLELPARFHPLPRPPDPEICARCAPKAHRHGPTAILHVYCKHSGHGAVLATQVLPLHWQVWKSTADEHAVRVADAIAVAVGVARTTHNKP
jgi:hypothetical protein